MDEFPKAADIKHRFQSIDKLITQPKEFFANHVDEDERRQQDEIKQEHLLQKENLLAGNGESCREWAQLSTSELITNVLGSFKDQDLSAIEEQINNPTDRSTQLKSSLALINLGRQLEKLNDALLVKCKDTEDVDRHWRSSQLRDLRAQLSEVEAAKAQQKLAQQAKAKIESAKTATEKAGGSPEQGQGEAGYPETEQSGSSSSATGGYSASSSCSSSASGINLPFIPEDSPAPGIPNGTSSSDLSWAGSEDSSSDLSWDQVLDAVELARNLKEHFKTLERTKRKELKDVKKQTKRTLKVIEKVGTHLNQVSLGADANSVSMMY